MFGLNNKFLSRDFCDPTSPFRTAFKPGVFEPLPVFLGILLVAMFSYA